MVGRRRTLAIVAFFVVTWLTGTIWSLATPLMEFPDEPSHVRRAAAVVRGQLTGGKQVRITENIAWLVRIPDSIAAVDRPCWIHLPSPCAEDPPGRSDVLTESPTYHARTQPVYYAVVGLATLIRPGPGSIYGMRIATAALVALLLTLAAWGALQHSRPRWLLLGLAVGVTPMTVFLAGAVNPNGPEIAAGAALWMTSLAWLAFDSSSGAKRRLVPVAVAALALVGMRGLSPAWVVLILGCAALAAGRERLRERVLNKSAAIAGAAILLGVVGSSAWTRLADTFSGRDVSYPRYLDLGAAMYDAIIRLGTYQREMIGIFGWADTSAPEHVYLVWFMVVGALVLPALSVASTRLALLLLMLIVSTALLPIILQLPAAPEVGLIWQGRYLLPFAIGIPIVAGVVLADSGRWNYAPRLDARLASLLLGLIGLAHVAAFWWALHRHVIGASGPWIGFDARWEPPGGWIAIIAVYAAVITAWLWLVSFLGRPKARGEAATSSGSADPNHTAASSGNEGTIARCAS
jgi:Predicted membrane protein (DUF2142)